MEESDFSSDEYIQQLQGQNQELVNNQNSTLSNQAASSIFSGSQEPNLIVWQLELDNILERIEHLLKGETIGQDEEGNVCYIEPIDDDLKVLNDYGVKLIMNVISFYLNRNTILSNYDSTRVQKILFDLGNKLSNLIYTNYVKMGMDTLEKRARYPMLVLSILHTIESAYNRAIRGGERESLRTARVVTQNDSMNVNPMRSQGNIKRGVSIFKPSTWV